MERAPNGSIVVGAGGTSINVGFGPQRWEFRDYALYVHAREWWLEGVRNRARRLETERLAREAAVTPPEVVGPISYATPWRGFNQLGISTTTTRFSLSAPYVPQTGFVGGEATNSFARLGREILNLTGYGPDVPTGELIINGTLDALSFFPGAAAVMQPIKWGRIAKRLKKAVKLDAPEGGDDLIFRQGTFKETPSRLNRKSKEALQNEDIKIHGVSGSTKKLPGDCSAATCSAIENAGFKVHKTPTNANPNHVTIELPNPVTPEDAKKFNKLFGRE